MKSVGRRKKGIALIMALYVTAVVFALGTLFIADQINKSRTVVDYKEAKLALQSANLGLNFIVNYLGNVSRSWADSIVVRDPRVGGGPICPGGAVTFSYPITPLPGVPGVSITISPSTMFAATPDPRLAENNYNITFNDRIRVSDLQDRWANLSATLKITYFTSLASAFDSSGNCSSINIATSPPSGSVDPFAVSTLSVNVRAQVENQAQTVLFASRQVQWTGRRTLGLYSSFYQCWTCWDVAGFKYPNFTDGTDSASYLGNGYGANGTTGGLGQTSAKPCPTCVIDSSTSVFQSPYGSNNNGVLQINATAASTDPPAPQFNGAVLAYNNVNVTGSAVMNGKISANTGKAIELPTGRPWGDAEGAAIPTAPATLLSQYKLAKDDPACSTSGIKTVFVTTSQDVGKGEAGKTPHNIEYDPTGAHQKPGYAVTDITLNDPSAGGKVTLRRLGYYSGGVLYEESFNASDLKNGVVYVHGGNVRVHGDLTKAGLTVVSDQGEGFFKNNGATDITPTDTASPCLAPYNVNIGTGGDVVPLSSARRFSSFSAGPGAAGQDYWIPNVCGGQCDKAFYTKSNDSACRMCLFDGTYINASGGTVGYHADDVNGQPVTAAVTSSGGSYSSSDPNAQVSIFAQPPQFDSATGRLINPNPESGLTAATCPTNCLFDSAKPVSIVSPVDVNVGGSSKRIWPYPGASTAVILASSGTVQEALFFTRQFENSEGNVTVSGDTTGVSLGLVARNYILLNDFVAGSTGTAIPNSKSQLQDYTMRVRASMVSTNHSVQWEGLLFPDPVLAEDVYVNGDYAALNSKYYNLKSGPAPLDYKYRYKDKDVQAAGWEGAPLSKPGSGIVSPLMTQPNPGNGKFWSFNFMGLMAGPYQDIVNTTDAGGYTGYAVEQVRSDMNNTLGFPPGFPVWNFAQWQRMNLTAAFPTVSYADLGALQSFR